MEMIRAKLRRSPWVPPGVCFQWASKDLPSGRSVQVASQRLPPDFSTTVHVGKDRAKAISTSSSCCAGREKATRRAIRMGRSMVVPAPFAHTVTPDLAGVNRGS